MSAYMYTWMDGADLNGKVIELNGGAASDAIVATAGTRYGNPLTSTGLDEIRTVVKDCLDLATGDNWTIGLQQVNRYRWQFTLSHDGAAPWDIENTGDFDWTLLGFNPAGMPFTVGVGATVPAPFMPWGVWYWHPGQVWRRRPAYKGTSTEVRTAGFMTNRRASKYHVWEFWFDPVRGAHIWASDLAVQYGSVSSDPSDPNLPFETVWDRMTDDFYFVPDIGGAPTTVYTLRLADEDFLEDIRSGTDDRTETPLAILKMKFTAWER